MTLKQTRLLLIGAGNVGRRFLELLIRKENTLRDRLGLELTVVGVADTSGVAVCPTGLPPQQIVDLKAGGQNVAEYARAGAAAVGVGSALVTGPDQPMDDLITRARRIRKAWNGAKEA